MTDYNPTNPGEEAPEPTNPGTPVPGDGDEFPAPSPVEPDVEDDTDAEADK